MSAAAPISLDDVLEARARIAPHLFVTPLRSYGTLDAEVGRGLRVLVKHENHLPTNAFKVRNNLSVLTALPREELARGVVAATRGNHGLGLAYAAKLLGARATVCVPVGNNPEKNAAVRALGAELVEEGRDYDESTLVADRLVRERGMRLVHSTNDPLVVAGAATLTLEIFEQAPDIDALVLAVGGGSQAVGALTVARALATRAVRVYGVQATGAPAMFESWRRRTPTATPSADTFADGVATRRGYELTLGALIGDAAHAGLADFVTVSDAEIAEAVRSMIRHTHNLAEGAGAIGLAGLMKLRDAIPERSTVAIALSGSNIDAPSLERIMTRAL